MTIKVYCETASFFKEKFSNLEEIVHILNSDDFKKYLAIKSDTRKYEFIFGRYFIKNSISNYLNININNISISINDLGKPFLVQPKIGLDFNLSHSKNYFILGISNTRVGVDIEEIKPIDISSIDIFCSATEKEYITRSDTNWLFRFYLVWTMKEALLKAKGTGFLYNDLLSITVPFLEEYTNWNYSFSFIGKSHIASFVWE